MAITVDACKVFLGRQIREEVITETQSSTPYGVKAADSTLPRKTSKEKVREPYLKPTQVDEENIQRRS